MSVEIFKFLNNGQEDKAGLGTAVWVNINSTTLLGRDLRSHMWYSLLLVTQDIWVSLGQTFPYSGPRHPAYLQLWGGKTMRETSGDLESRPGQTKDFYISILNWLIPVTLQSIVWWLWWLLAHSRWNLSFYQNTEGRGGGGRPKSGSDLLPSLQYWGDNIQRLTKLSSGLQFCPRLADSCSSCILPAGLHWPRYRGPAPPAFQYLTENWAEK